MQPKIETKVEFIHDGKFYAHSILASQVFVYIGDALKNSTQIALQKDGTVWITSAHHTDEKTAKIISRVIKSSGGTVGAKLWWCKYSGRQVKLKKYANRYTQTVVIEHGTTIIEIELFVDLAQ